MNAKIVTHQRVLILYVFVIDVYKLFSASSAYAKWNAFVFLYSCVIKKTQDSFDSN